MRRRPNRRLLPDLVLLFPVRLFLSSLVMVAAFQPLRHRPGRARIPGIARRVIVVAAAALLPVLPCPADELKRPMAQIHGLLVLPLEGQRFAGQASKMSAVALPGRPDRLAGVRFNQEVGPDMSKALEEVVKFTRIRHPEWPTGKNIELSFAEPYSPKDGPSAAVACALLLESMLGGVELDPRVAVTGDLGVDGTVRSVGGIGGKLRGARMGDCTMVAIPRDNVRAVVDLVVSEGLGPLLEGHIFALENFDDALALAVEEKDSRVAEGLKEFELIQRVARRQQGSTVALMRHPKAQERLLKVIEAVPQHLSARLLLSAGQGRLPRRLSLPGSLEAIDQSGYDLLSASREGTGDDGLDGGRLNEDQLRDAVDRIRAMRPMLDERTIGLSDRLLELGRKVVEWRDRRPSSPAASRDLLEELNGSAERVGTEWRRLLNDPEVVEQLMR